VKVVIIGAGGHARVVYEILKHEKNIEIAAFVDIVKHGSGERILGVPILGDHSVLPKLLKNGVAGAIIAVGNNKIRTGHFKELENMGFELINAIHPTAHIAGNIKIGKGVVIGAGAIIATCAEIGNNVIVNTGAVVEHECVIEDNVHIAPGTILAGRVTVKKGAFVGAGSVVKEYVTIGENVTIGAGSVVLEDILPNAVAVGSPARIVKMCGEAKSGKRKKKH